jgi:hypothetical protein
MPKKKMLVTFINPVGVIVEGRAITTTCLVAEELYQGTFEATPKDMKKAFSAPRMPLDFPLFLKVLALGDFKSLAKVQQVIVKYNNISSIVEFED